MMFKVIKAVCVAASLVALPAVADAEAKTFLKCDEAKPLKFVFSDAKYREFPLPGLKGALAAIPPEDRPRDFYIKCRAARLDGSV